jgi:peptide/nickel transport system substrate-binding protein
MMITRYGMVVVLAVVLVGCAPQSQAPSVPGASGTGVEPARPSPKRIVATIKGAPAVLTTKYNARASVPGVDMVEQLLNSGLTVKDSQGTLRAQLAEEVPSLENGRWKLLPDGRMETSWTIRAGAIWHDGTPFTADDLRFTAEVAGDKELAILRSVAFDALERIETPDARTLIVTWSKPYIDADQLFTILHAPPLPQHLLGQIYQADKRSLLEQPFWSQEYIGTGPYRLTSFVRDSHITLAANERYVLGRPKIDEIEVRLIEDLNTLIANVLAGTVELSLGRGLSIDQALQLRGQWTQGRIDLAFAGWVVLFPQFVNPEPDTLADVRLRRALLNAIDRQQLVDTLQGGMAPIADAFLSPSEPEYATIQRQIVRYTYDPRAAAQGIETLGYARASDGTWRSANGQRLAVEVRAPVTSPVTEKAMLSVANDWQQLGIVAEPVVVPPQRMQDREYFTTFPGFLLVNQPNELVDLQRLRSVQTPLPENSFVGRNYARYQDPEFDHLIDRLFSTVPRDERTQVLGQIMHHMSSQLNVIGLFHNAAATLVGNRLQHVNGEGGVTAWNGHEWDVR